MISWSEPFSDALDFVRDFPRFVIDKKLFASSTEKGYTGPLSSSRSFEVRRSMALFIMKWMDLSLKECRLQGLSFLRASPVFLFRSD